MSLCIMGPTASGKTALAVELVKRFPFEIISVDSALVYREMNIGTAKPDAATLRIAPHRLIDIIDPSEAYSAGQFCIDARVAIAQIQTKGRIPLLVGGTMLYYRALLRGLAELPPAAPPIRARLAKELTDSGLQVLHTRLARVDPVAAARIHPHDPQRILRALEVYELTGRTVTELYAQRQNELNRLSALRLIIAPADRTLLYRHIEQRFGEMLEKGFVSEVVSLRARGDLSLDKPSMRAVGYRQVWEYLEGLTNYSKMVQRAIIATRQFAKRQLTWLRAEPDVPWFDSAATGFLDRIVEYLYKTDFFQGSL